jgi:phage-related tail protein
MGRTREQAESLADTILRTPDKTAFLRGDITDLAKKLADARARLASAPASKRVAIQGEISDLARKLAAAQRLLNAIDSKTIYLTTVNRVINTGGGGRGPNAAMAHGGVVGAAGGGPRSGLTWVGELGPELVDLAAGSTVHSANASRQMMSGASGGSNRPIELVVNLDGRTIVRQIFDPFRAEIRDKGGNVQQALGAN